MNSKTLTISMAFLSLKSRRLSRANHPSHQLNLQFKFYWPGMCQLVTTCENRNLNKRERLSYK